MVRITKKKFKEACVDSGGNQARIASKIGVSRQAINIFIKKHPELRELIENEAEKLIDVAEDNIDMDIMVKHDIDSSKWKLLNSKKGKNRGYGIKNEIEHIGESIGVVFNLIEKSVEEIKSEKLNNQPKAGGTSKGTR